MASGLARLWPAMSGAEPWEPARRAPCACPLPWSSAPSEAEGSMPSEPVSMGRDVGEDVAEEIVASDDVVLAGGLAHELHGRNCRRARVRGRRRRIPHRARGDDLLHNTPDFITLCFSAEETLLLRFAGEIEGDAGDASRFSPVV